MIEQECVPYAPALIESMRSLGYSFSSAIADLIDNSISAKAERIDIIAEPSSNPVLIIFDNGCGMSKKELYEAMRYGSINPLDERDPDDLGRFGLGMKSASLSQCRKLIVVSKKDGEINCSSWDMDYVVEKGKWVLKVFSEEEIMTLPHIELLMGVDHGTMIILSDFDRIMEGTGNISETFNKNLIEMSDHLSLVFHRYIDEGVRIFVNNRELDSFDPFLSAHPATQRKKEQKIRIKNETIVLKPFILPHFSKLKDSDLKLIGGKDRLRTEQGFYVYRNKRLIIWGTWFRLERKDELNKLARVRVDIPNTLDYMWSIDVKKSTANLPDIIKKNMYSAVYESVAGSEQIHTHRGRKENDQNDIDYIWDRVKKRNGYAYLINRDIPQIKMLSNTLDKSQKKMLENVIKTLEDSFPTSALYVDAAKGNLDEKEKPDNDDEIRELWKEITMQMDYVKNMNLSIVEYYKAFAKVEPYCNYPQIVQKIQKEIKKYE